MKNKEYIIRNKYYPKEDLGRIVLDFNKETGVLYLKDSYEGLHPDFLIYMWSKKGRKIIDGMDARRWVHDRVCPPERHNIRDILKAYGLPRYSATRILDMNCGRCDKDDLWFEEIGG